jgi:GTP-binding protein
MLIKSVDFVKSSSKWQECPEANIPEYAFIGRSSNEEIFSHQCDDES